MIVLDGAHHPAAAHELRRAAEQLLPGRRLILLVATMSDKDVESMASELGPTADLVIVTRAPGTERAAPTARLAAAFASVTPAPTIVVEEDADRALARALQEVDADSALLVTGSLYLVGHVRDACLAAMVAR
jgi:dihydrofolate synthase/folylpolyglutamate synthase